MSLYKSKGGVWPSTNAGSEVSSAETVLKPRRPFAHRVKANLRRFWYLHLIGLAIFILTTVLLVDYVIVPHLAQTGVNAATLDVVSMALTNPTPNSFDLYQDSILHSASAFHPFIEGFNASLFLEDTEPNIVPMAYLQVPATQSAAALPLILNQTVQIANMDQFSKYANLVLTSKEYRLAIRGRPLLRQPGFAGTYVDFNQVLTLKGLNNLQGFNVTQAQILIVPEADGSNMVGKTMIPNPTTSTIALGNLTLNLFVKNDLIGTAFLPNLSLAPGNNTVDMRSNINQSLVLEKLPQFPSGVLPIEAVGKSVIYNGQHLTYFENSLSTNTQTLSLNVTALLGGAI